MGHCYPEIIQYMTSKGVQPMGPPYALYYNMDMSALDIEIGFPVRDSLEGNDRIQPASLPAGKAAMALHVGPYEKIEETYNALAAFVKERHLTPKTFSYEFYLNDPRETKPEDLKTEIYFPLEDFG